MKFVRDQKFYWRESYEFARARAKSAPRPRRLRQAAILAFLFAAPLLLVSLPETAGDVLFISLFAVTSSLLTAYVLAPLIDKMPNGIMVASNRIVVGQHRILLEEIESAVVGTTRLQATNFPVLSIQMRNGVSHMLGLGPKVNGHELSRFLQRAGIHEPQA